jgi:hypothetical protein
MSMKRREPEQSGMWVATHELPRSPGHVFYEKLNEVLAYIRKLHRKPRGGERLSYAAIAERLNAEGIRTRTGRAWAPGTVYGILNRQLPR